MSDTDTTTTTEKNQVLLLSHPSAEIELRSLARRMHQFITTGKQHNDDSREDQSTWSPSSPVTLKTKYYTAGVSFQVRDQLVNVPVGENQALVALYHDRESMQHVQEQITLHPSLVDAIDTKLIAYHDVMEAGADQDEEDHFGKLTESILEWCLDHGFEQARVRHSTADGEVESVGKDESEESNGDESNHLFREKTGVERIVEALESTIWPHMNMIEPSKRTNDNVIATDTPAGLAVEAALDSVREEKDDGVSKDKGKQTEPADEENMLRSVLFSLVGDEHEGPDEGESDPSEITEFDNLLSGMLKLKEERITGQLDRDVLKDRAADLAMKMMEVMGLDEDDVDDSESES